MCLSYSNTITELGDEYKDIVYNNAPHIYSVAAHFGTVDVHKFLP